MERDKKQIQSFYYFPKMDLFILELFERYQIFIKNKLRQGKALAATKPFEIVDIIGGFGGNHCSYAIYIF